MLQTWLNSQHDVSTWAGPSIVFPASKNAFSTQLKQHDYQSFALLHQRQLVGFGQLQQHAPHLHLGRLIIKPSMRGNGFASVLLRSLINAGNSASNIRKVSLYVHTHNQRAYNVYAKYGFIKTSAPTTSKVNADCDYLTLKLP